ncbi:MAG: glutamate--cysteine ligase [Alphaproteobacteria bacterium]
MRPTTSPRKGSPEPITSRDQLVAYLEAGCKPKAEWRIGTEHEKFAFRLDDLSPLPYGGPQGIGALLAGLMRFGWRPVTEAGKVVALAQDQSSVTLEPGGQVELSGEKVPTIHDTCAEVQEHLRQVKEVGAELGVGLLGLGFQPKARREEMPWMPKGRYDVMRAYMPKVGRLGIDMMLRTCTVQVNLDFESEACMVRKLRLGLALQPVATALLANSPFADGEPTGFLSYRSYVWTHTDPDRCGILPFVFEDGMGFERYVDYLLDVPMYFVYRDGRYIDASGQSFRDFLDGRLPALPGEAPHLGDWEDHLTIVFPEVRLKRYLEMRGADGGPWAPLCALPALWVGILYDRDASEAAWDLVKDWTEDDHVYLRREVPHLALKTPFRGRTMRELALELLEIASYGLGRRARLNDKGEDEARFLKPLLEIAHSGKTPAEQMIEAYETRWQRSVDPVFTEHVY